MFFIYAINRSISDGEKQIRDQKRKAERKTIYLTSSNNFCVFAICIFTPRRLDGT